MDIHIGKMLYRGGDRYVVTAWSDWRGGGWRLDLLQPDGITYKQFRGLSKLKSGLMSEETIKQAFTEQP